MCGTVFILNSSSKVSNKYQISLSANVQCFSIDFYSTQQLEATLTLDLENPKGWRATVFTLHGVYDFVSRAAYFAPPEEDRLGVVLHFDGVSSDKFFGFIESFAHNDQCAKFFFTKVRIA